MAIRIARSRPTRSELVTIALYEEPLVLVVPRRHRLADRGRITVEALGGEDLIVLKPGYGLRVGVDDLLAGAPVAPRIAFEVEDTHTARGLVSAGLGVSVLPSYPPDAETDQVRIDHPKAVRTIGAVARPGAVAPSVSAFVSFLRTSGAAVAASSLGPYARPLPAQP